MSSAEEAVAEKSAVNVEVSVERRPTAALLATDACCQAGHDVAELERGGGEIPMLVCVTCTELWGRLEGLRSWRHRCSTCFAEAYPEGLSDLGITAEPLSELQ